MTAVRSVYRSPGELGIRETLRHMRGMVHESMEDPELVFLARRLIQAASRYDRRGQIARIRSYLKSATRWLPDPLDVEYLVSPSALLGQVAATGRAGADCDDVALLGASLLHAVGIPSRFVAVGFADRGPLQHVFAEGWDGESWRELDTTRPPRNARRIRRALTLGV